MVTRQKKRSRSANFKATKEFASCETACFEKLFGIGVSPKVISLREYGRRVNGRSRLEEQFFEKRIKTLRESRYWHLQLAKRNESSEPSPAFCMDIDAAEERYLLSGACNGLVSIHDLGFFNFDDREKPLEPVVYNHCRHRHMVTRCQWYPRDSSMFITSSMDKTVMLWDTNRMQPLDQYHFNEAITQIHWSTVPSCKSLIAVANLTSNIELIDPRAGEAIQNLRWKVESVSSVQWSAELDYLLLTGGKNGNISVWDIRRGKSHLKLLQTKAGSAHRAAVGGLKFSTDGLFVVTMSIDRVIRVWNAYNMELIRSIKLEKELIATPSNPTISFDIISSNSAVFASIPYGDDILIVELSGKYNRKRHVNEAGQTYMHYLLKGHFQYVNACLFRSNVCQVLSSANDRSILLWSPEMDEVLSDEAYKTLDKLQQDQWSDED